MNKKFILFLPLILLLSICLLLFVGLHKDPKQIASALINKPVPEFYQANLLEPSQIVSPRDFPKKPFLLNVWGSWCGYCQQEHPLFFLYIGVLALYSAYSDRAVGAKSAGILCIVGVVNLPIIHFSVEWWNTLHQGASITKFEKPSIATPMLIPLILCIFGFLFLSIWFTLVRYRVELLKEDSTRPWVKELASKLK